MASTAVVIADGAVGLTGYTRAIVRCNMEAAATTVTFTLPLTFIVKGFIPGVMKQDGGSTTVALSYSTGTYTATFAAAPGAGVTEIILFGELGRRDMPNENPQGNFAART